MNPKTGFAGGRIIDKSFDLKAAMDGVVLISGSSLFHTSISSETMSDSDK